MAARTQTAQKKKGDIIFKLDLEDQSSSNVKLQMGDTVVTLPKRKLLRVVFDEILGRESAPAHVVSDFVARSSSAPVPPALGMYWPGQGGDYIGTVFNPDGADYHLIVGPEMDGEKKHKDAMDWAKGLKVDGHNDFDLPNRREGRFLQCNGKHLFKDKWHWLSEQHAGDSGCAWAQDFENGLQYYWPKDLTFRARAVRRVPIR